MRPVRGRPVRHESDRRRREFLALVADGVPAAEAAKRARLSAERALRIASEPWFLELVAAGREETAA